MPKLPDPLPGPTRAARDDIAGVAPSLLPRPSGQEQQHPRASGTGRRAATAAQPLAATAGCAAITLRAFAAAARQSLVGHAARLRSHPQSAQFAALLQRHAHEPVGAVLQDELRGIERAGGASSPSAPAEPVDYFLRRRALAPAVTR